MEDLFRTHVREFRDRGCTVLLSSHILGAFGAFCVVAAFVLAERRDLGAGLFADRVGPSRASSRLRHPLGLAWRIQRGFCSGGASFSLG